jgi:cell division protein FtsW
MRPHRFDRTFLLITGLLVAVGFLMFASASLGLLAREGGGDFTSIAFNQLFLGIGVGLLALLITANIRYRFWRKISPYLFVAALTASLLVFVPGLGFSSGGATRWLHLGPLSWQPAEFLKIAYVLYLAGWLSGVKDRVHEFRYSILPFMVITGLAAIVLFLQRDTGTFMVVIVAGLAMLFVAGARWRDIIILFLITILAVGVIAFNRPYVLERILTFLDPARDPSGSGYQLQQSFIAIGSGGLTGRGFGQSVQKFNYLPEPVGDSVFAVAAEEFGFLGGATLITLFLFLGVQGFRIAIRSPDTFGGLVGVGIVILILSQSFINMASMLGVLPLTGLPLLFVSHGGTAMLFALAEVGIMLNISRYRVG